MYIYVSYIQYYNVPYPPCVIPSLTDPQGDKQVTSLLTVNAKNLMTAVGEVLKTTESALLKVPK